MTTSVVNPTSNPSAFATATTAPTGNTNQNNNNSGNPLLFFVALGFGVLFTNLWIIIGVKYCFRYQNARRRGIPMHGDGHAMGTIHNGRRRREKKLMTREEVETQFPLMTYKAWRAQRERMGLSTEGGVQAVGQEEAQNAREVLQGTTTGRAPSIRSVRTARSRRASHHSIVPVETSDTGIFEISKDGTAYKQEAVEHEEIAMAMNDKAPSSPATKRVSMVIEREVSADSPQTPKISTPRQSMQEVDHSPDSPTLHESDIAEQAEAEVDEAEIQHLPDDIGSGDTCAICIDTLEEDDEVRGLTCGHAFHSSCVDVWLTTRRAICPLCKRDYWVRKTPAPGTEPVNALPEDFRAARSDRFGQSFFPHGFSRRYGRNLFRDRRQGASTAPQTDLETGTSATPRAT